jgi:hypothetical protein
VPAWHKDRTPLLQLALQLSLELHHERCVSVCVRNAAPVGRLDLLRLYDQLFDDLNPPLIQLFRGIGKPTERMESFRASGETDVQADLRDPVYRFYPVEVWAELQKIVPGLCNYWRLKLRKAGLEAGGASGGVSGGASGGGDGGAYTKLVETTQKPLKIGPRWLDVYVWAVLLGKTDLALSLVTACQEPMRAAVIGARLCNEMATLQPLHQVSLAAASARHEAWAMSLLDLCESFEDAARMLITESATWTKPLLHMAVQSDLRPFCSHVQCQLLADEWLLGNSDLFARPSAVLRHDDVSTARMLWYMIFPVDLPGMDPMLAWRLPLQMSPSDGAALCLPPTPPFYEYYRIPMVKLIVRCTMHLLYTLLLSFATIETPMTWAGSLVSEGLAHHVGSHVDLSEKHEIGHDGGGLESYTVDGVLWLWSIAFCFDEFHKYAQQPTSFVADVWNIYDYIMFTIVQLALFMRFLSLKTSVEAMCFASILVWCRLFKYLQIDYNLGVLVIILTRMVKDIAMWFTLTSIVLVAFTVAFVSITNPYVIEDSGNHPITAPLWALLGQWDLAEVNDWNPSVGRPMMWIFVLVSNVVLVNLLIAMMGYTFSKVNDQADQEWKFGRVSTIIQLKERFCEVPPPLNLPITLYTFVRFFGRKIFRRGEGDDASGEEHVKELKAAKKAKAKVARRLLFALKRSQEDERMADEGTAQLADALKELRELSTEQMALLRDALVTPRDAKELTLKKKTPLSFRGSRSVAA